MSAKMSSDELRIERRLGWLDPVYTFEQAYGFLPMPWQIPYLRSSSNAAILKGRQVGASTGAGAIAIRYARHFSNFLVAIVSPSMKQSTEVKLKAKNGLIRLGEDLVQDSQDTITLDNGSRIISLPGSPKSVRGWSAGLLIIDEAAFLDPETFLAARATVAATGGRTIVQSTPISPFGHFYDLYSTPDPAWEKYQVSSEEVSTIDPEFLRQEKLKLTVDEYAQEYLGAFASPGLGLVDPNKLRGMTKDPNPATRTIWDTLRDSK